MDGGDWISAGIAVLALAVSLASVAYGRQQAREAVRANEISARALEMEARRDLEASRSQITVTPIGSLHGGVAQYSVSNDGPADLDLVRITLVSPNNPRVVWVDPPWAEEEKVLTITDLKAGSGRAPSAYVGKYIHRWGQIVFKVECRQGVDEWTQIFRLPPPKPDTQED